MTNRLKDQLDHPLYKRAKEIWERIRHGQIKKASEKYPEPLNHRSWTAVQLVEHGIMENVDQLHYYVCLLEKIEELERQLLEATQRAVDAETERDDIIIWADRERRKWSNYKAR